MISATDHDYAIANDHSDLLYGEATTPDYADTVANNFHNVWVRVLHHTIVCDGYEECKSNAALTTCVDDATCTIICSGTRSCYETTFTCPSGAECNIHCEDANEEVDVCRGSTILAQQSTKLNVICVGVSACQLNVIECPFNGDCNIQGHGDNAIHSMTANASLSIGNLNIESLVKNTTVSGSSVHAGSHDYCPLIGNCFFNLYGFNAVYGSQIHASHSDGIVNITVSATEALRYVTLRCPDAYQSGTPNCLIRVIQDANDPDNSGMLSGLNFHSHLSFEQVSIESVGLLDSRMNLVESPRMYCNSSTTQWCYVIYVNGEYQCAAASACS
eukprot:663330_1